MTYEISTDTARLDLDLIHRYLSEEAYWSPRIPREVVARAIANSLCFGVYAQGLPGRSSQEPPGFAKEASPRQASLASRAKPGAQVGFARLITDRATYAYLADVFVLPEHRGKGLSKRLMERIIAYPEVQGLRRWTLATRASSMRATASRRSQSLTASWSATTPTSTPSSSHVEGVQRRPLGLAP